jgi:putative ABC transport system permease protein
MRANLARYTATIVAIVAGVGFLAAGLIATDSIRASLGGNAADQFPSVAAAVQPASSIGSTSVIPESVVATVTGVAGVESAAGTLTAPLSVFDPDTGKPLDTGASGSLWVTDTALNPLDIAEGRAPSATGEIAIDRRTAERLDDATVGTSVDVATVSGKERATVVGITEFGGQAALDEDGTISVGAPWAYSVLGDGTPGYSQILVQGPTDGPEQADIVQAITAAVPGGYDVLDRDEFLAQQAGIGAQLADLARPVLIGFALLALFVCAFVIYNTFSVVVTQRTKELALLRAVAATPRQVKRSVRLEGLVIGFVGSLIGVLLGAGLALVAPPLLARFGLSLGSVGISVSPLVVILCLVVGTLVTVVSVLAPARRAARTPPVEAMRSEPTPTARTTAFRTIFSLVLMVGGAVALILGGTFGQALLIGLGALVFVLGVLVGGPIIAAWFARLARALTGWTGLTGRLASDSLVRNPRRTATTANALVVGVLLVTFVSIAGATSRDWAVEQINQLSTANVLVSSTGGGIDPDLIRRFGDVDGVTAVASVTVAEATVAGTSSPVAGGDPELLAEAADLDVTAGSLADLDTGGIAVVAFGGSGTIGGAELGDTVTVTAPDGTSKDVPIVAEVSFSLSSISLNNLMAPDTFTSIFGELPVTSVYVGTEPDQLRAVTDRIDELTTGYSNIAVAPGNIFGEIVGGLFDFAINAVVALLGMSVIIAVIGIVNTLSLSIFEQRREIAMLRAIGMLPREVRAMVRLEAVLISMVGTLTGLAAGLFLAFFMTRPIDVGFSWQPSRLGIIVLLGILVGFLAALAPARRVSRIDLLQALQP